MFSIVVKFNVKPEYRDTLVNVLVKDGIGSLKDEPGTVRLSKVEEAIIGQKPDRQTLSAIAPLAQDNLKQLGEKLGFPADLYASSQYRIHIGGVLTKRALGRAVEQAGLTL